MHTEQQANSQGDTVNMGMAAERHLQRSQNGKGGEGNFTLTDMMAVMGRLAQVLAEEVDCLDSMKIKGMEGLQEEKSRLTRTLTAMKRRLDRTPDLLGEISDEEKAAYHQVADIFNNVMEENRQRLLVAKEVNYRMVQAICDVVEEENRRSGYSHTGGMTHRRDGTSSVSLNETI